MPESDTLDELLATGKGRILSMEPLETSSVRQIA